MREAGCAKGRGNECYSVAEAGSKFILIRILQNMKSWIYWTILTLRAFYSQNQSDTVAMYSVKPISSL